MRLTEQIRAHRFWAFHRLMSSPDSPFSVARHATAAIVLILALALPLAGLAVAYWLTTLPVATHLNHAPAGWPT